MTATIKHRIRMLAFQERQQELHHRGAIAMQTRTYTEKSNARRAARAAGVDPNLVVATEDGFTFPAPAEEEDAAELMDNGRTTGGKSYFRPTPAPTNGHAHETNDVDTTASAEQMKAEHAAAILPAAETVDTPPHDPVDTAKPEADEGIPAFCKIDPEERKAAWARNPPKAAPAPIKEADVAKTSKAKAGTKKPKGAKDKTSGADKIATMLAMLKKGATVDALTKATGWLPHTLRARISGVAKPKSKGGEGLKIERERVDGVTSYRVAS